ncbi:MAG: hypothetical protein FVQ83_10635 [Chloroflexi bacterium]|nr:hypothetical protein [Chloroflexota bacterium]
MAKLDDLLAQEFVCQRCNNTGAHVERLAMTGTGLSRFIDIQRHQYAFASCENCGFTEVYNLKILEELDDLGTVLDIIFSK